LHSDHSVGAFLLVLYIFPDLYKKDIGNKLWAFKTGEGIIRAGKMVPGPADEKCRNYLKGTVNDGSIKAISDLHFDSFGFQGIELIGNGNKKISFPECCLGLTLANFTENEINALESRLNKHQRK